MIVFIRFGDLDNFAFSIAVSSFLSPAIAWRIADGTGIVCAGGSLKALIQVNAQAFSTDRAEFHALAKVIGFIITY